VNRTPKIKRVFIPSKELGLSLHIQNLEFNEEFSLKLTMCGNLVKIS